MVLQVESEDPQLAKDLAEAIPVAFSRKNAAVQTERYSDSKANLTKEIDSLKEQVAQKQTDINAIGTPSGPAKEAELARAADRTDAAASKPDLFAAELREHPPG